MFGFGLVFFRLLLKNRPKPADFLVRNRKTDLAIFNFWFATLYMTGKIEASYITKIERRLYYSCTAQQIDYYPGLKY